MRVLMLQTVEDANELSLGDPLAQVETYTVGHRVHKRHISRVDKLRRGSEPDLPAAQATKLIALGYAEPI